MVLPDWEEVGDWLKARAWLLLLGLAAGAAGIHQWRTGPVHPPGGILVPEEPNQGAPASSEAWTFQDHRIVPLATFELRARVLGRERYRFDRAAELSPLDLALGWGSMSDSTVLDRLRIRQDGRWYYWSAATLPLSAAEIVTHSANMHMIPADAFVRRQLMEVRVGQVIRLRGQLVRVEGLDRWTWISSLSRVDSGEGACEVVWVESVGPG